MPTKGSRLAAGHDLYAIKETIIPARGQAIIETGIAVGLPPIPMLE
jgi:dUTPase